MVNYSLFLSVNTLLIFVGACRRIVEGISAQLTLSKISFQKASTKFVGAVAGFLHCTYMFLYFYILDYMKHMGKYTKKPPTPPTIMGIAFTKYDIYCVYVLSKCQNCRSLVGGNGIFVGGLSNCLKNTF